ncbi:MAG: hypothetical protein Q8O34_00690 [Rhodocyclaceae bacterium]|nr:hypothetical protein [Rhodocyclaceae bacterium]
MPALKPLHIFKPGRHTAMSGATLEFSATDLAASANAYDPAKFEAPLVVGHPSLDAPAYGWVSRLTAGADGLDAETHQVDAAFAELVSEGRFKKISASFFMPSAPGNPAPGVFYLRHVGFLGAAAPAVKGLRTPEFSADEAGVETIEFSTHEEMSAVTPEEKAALEAENAQLKQQIADAAAREKAAASARRHADHASFCEGLVTEGRLAPGLLPAIVQTLDFVAGQEQGVEFAEGEVKKPLADALRDALKAAPKLIEFAERSADRGGSSGARVAGFAAPPGLEVDAAALDVHNRARAYAEAHKVDYVAAVAAVQKGV